VGVTVLQAPAPLQNAVGVADPDVQLAVPHTTVGPGLGPHAPGLEPSQMALHGPVPVHVVRVP
jgi:hypothetical protein